MLQADERSSDEAPPYSTESASRRLHQIEKLACYPSTYLTGAIVQELHVRNGASFVPAVVFANSGPFRHPSAGSSRAPPLVVGGPDLRRLQKLRRPPYQIADELESPESQLLHQPDGSPGSGASQVVDETGYLGMPTIAPPASDARVAANFDQLRKEQRLKYEPIGRGTQHNVLSNRVSVCLILEKGPEVRFDDGGVAYDRGFVLFIVENTGIMCQVYESVPRQGLEEDGVASVFGFEPLCDVQSASA